VISREKEKSKKMIRNIELQNLLFIEIIIHYPGDPYSAKDAVSSHQHSRKPQVR
jgi:hypothetical protein